MRATVLIVEDDADIREVVAESVGEAGFEPACATHDGLPELANVALVVTDLPAPARLYTSEVAVRWAEALAARYGAPVVVMTAHAAAASDAELRRHCAGVIAKPFEIDALVALLRESTSQVRSSDVR